MAKITVSLACSIKWWVQPYLWAAARATAVVSMARGGLSDEQVERLAQKHAEFVTKHGVRISVSKAD